MRSAMAKNRKVDLASRARRGFSLVEILVVLVILIIGIFAITRLFPQGFASLNYTTNLTQANALIRYNQQYLENHVNNLPDGMAAVDPVSGGLRYWITPNDIQDYRYDPTAFMTVNGIQAEDPRKSGVNKVRRVIGEQLRVPPARAASLAIPNETVSLHHSLFAPIYSVGPSPGVALGVDAYSGTPLQQVEVRGDQDPVNPADDADLQAQNSVVRLIGFGYGLQYPYVDRSGATPALDYTRAAVYLPSHPSRNRQYRIEFVYRDATGAAIQSSPGMWISVAANSATTVTEHVLTFPNAESLDSLFLFRRFELLPAGTAFSADPFEYKVYDPVSGLFGFNPTLASPPVPQRDGKGIAVRIDYDVDDWHIVRQDVVVPLEGVEAAGSPVQRHPVKLLTSGIKKYLDVEDVVNFDASGADTFEYQTLVRWYPGSVGGARQGTAPGIDLILVDMSTGYRIDSRTLQKPASTNDPTFSNANGEIDYEAGVIHLNATATFYNPLNPGQTQSGPTAGRNLRVFYRTSQDFAAASLKPYASYSREPDQTAPQFPLLQAQEYTPVYDSASGQVYLLFAGGDGEKTVAVDYSYRWVDPAGGSPPREQYLTEVGELHRIQPPAAAGAPPIAGLNKWWVRLNRSARDPGVDPTSIAISGVRGASYHTRIVWREAGRWKHLQRSTLLSRAPAQ